MIYIWLTITILLLILEFITRKITNIWYVISSILAIIVTEKTNNFSYALLTFLVGGTFLLITTKPSIEKYLNKKNKKVE